MRILGCSGLTHYGPGFRVYLHRRGDVLIILLCGGDKASQDRDIRKAIEMVRNEESLRLNFQVQHPIPI